MLAAGLLASCGGPSGDPADRLDRYARGLALVERSLAAHGGLDSILDAGGVTLTLSGTFDLTTRLQGRSDDVPEPMPIAQTIVIDTAARRVSHTVDWHNYYASRQHLREVYEPDGRALFLDLRNRTGGWMPRAVVSDPVERFARYLPHLLLADALDQRRTLAAAGRVNLDGAPADRVDMTTANGDPLTLYLDTDTTLLRGASTVLPMPLLGDTPVRWVWSDHIEIDGLTVPGRLRSFLGDAGLADERLTFEIGPRAGAFEAPAGIDVPPAPEPGGPSPAFVPYGRREPRVDTIEPGVHLVRSLRPGFHLMFVEFADHVVAVDAPTGWHEMLQIPPLNWSAGDSISALGEKYLRAIRRTAPGKPVRHVVLTHHHSDHIGGVRPLLAAGAGVIAGAPAARQVRRAAQASFSLSPDALTGRTIVPSIEVVRGGRMLADSTMEMQLLELPDGNPKADGYLMVYLPRQRLLYTTAFVYPLPDEAFPPEESVDLSLYFVEWLDQSGLAVDRVLNVHGSGLVEPWHLDRIRAIAAARRASGGG